MSHKEDMTSQQLFWSWFLQTFQTFSYHVSRAICVAAAMKADLFGLNTLWSVFLCILDHFLEVRSLICKVGVVCVCLMPLVVQRQQLLAFSGMHDGDVGINELMGTSFNKKRENLLTLNFQRD